MKVNDSSFFFFSLSSKFSHLFSTSIVLYDPCLIKVRSQNDFGHPQPFLLIKRPRKLPFIIK